MQTSTVGLATSSATDERIAAAVRLLRTPARDVPQPRIAFLRGVPGAHPVCLALWPGETPLLADIVPLFEQFGLRLDRAAPHAEVPTWAVGHSLVLLFAAPSTPWDSEIMSLVEDAFPDAAHTSSVGDPFNRLVVATRTQWRDVQLLRAAASYLKQAGLGYSERYVVDILYRHPDTARALVQFFDARLNPTVSDREEVAGLLQTELNTLIERASTLDEDKILRGLVSFVRSVVRTNWYQLGDDNRPKPHRVFKLDPTLLSVRGPITPFREVFVQADDVEGLHVRSGLVARGGIRWSDRLEDYRVEVLGLMKTQRVKNSVIVPDGAKGAFVVRAGADPAISYETFIRGLLDVTDNLIDGQVVTPPGTVALDGPDPYLVVAADKGTARYSDRANSVAAQYGFWLGDAFAAGGSAGYDHKAMGITARGAWISVRRHFAELDLDVDQDDFTAVGVGDMSGDVFGNGMLLSQHIRLVGAFDHRHVFLDPDPDPSVSHAERARLAALPRSSWADYDHALISTGGGVWSRSTKQIPLSPEVQARLGVTASALPPDEVVKAILRSPVDLLWNGGIGTYIKASTETASEAADPGNDAVRVDAAMLRCRVVGVGGNLGVTQKARIEFALKGGKINGDFIDNAAGVNTSDREVNIKILLAAAEDAGQITREERDQVLAAATDEVAAQVLADSEQQTLAISLAEAQAPFLLDRHTRLVQHLETAYGLNREQEDLPDDEELEVRARRGQGLTRPEIAVLLAHSKNIVRDDLLSSNVLSDPAFASTLSSYFPESMRMAFAPWVPQHRLTREIIATCLANDLINHMGPGFIFRMEERFGAGTAHVAIAHATVRAVFQTDQLWQRVITTNLPVATTLALLQSIQEFVEGMAAWFLRHRGAALRPEAEVQRYGTAITALRAEIPAILTSYPSLESTRQRVELTGRSLPDGLTATLLSLGVLSRAPDAADTAAQVEMPIRDVLAAMLELDTQLDLEFLTRGISQTPGTSHWESMARAAVQDEVSTVRRQVLAAALQSSSAAPPDNRIRRWLTQNAAAVARFRSIADEMCTQPQLDLAMVCTALAELRLLLQSVTSPLAVATP